MRRCMRTDIVNYAPDSNWENAALRVLQAGGVVGVPTETVYGLAGDATNAESVSAIYAVKGRPSHNPLIVHVADQTMAERYAAFSPLARRLAEAFWPGPLTLVLPLAENTRLAPAVTAGGNSLAVRCPTGPLNALASALGNPLAAPSANRSGHVSSTTAQHVADDLDGLIPLIIDGGPTTHGLESSIVDVQDDMPVLLRPGAVDRDTIERVIGGSLSMKDAVRSAPVAPGLLASHYAPSVPVRLNVLPDDVQPGEAYLGFGEHALPGQTNLSANGDLKEAAARLYAALRAIDQQRPKAIAVAPIPGKGLGLALTNRLERAAAPRA